ncbi:MAG: alcohol dehydrogenase catalytic domain-containing protein [Acidobacteria bacterium]|nr:alcohol dehydrogenase catalytic domain-containing protein [Acidobacteriota bacterium]MBI3279526.1 alcohol dehydrogenase catalytic domain-containing protein [Acidobacteriota bacterium]
MRAVSLDYAARRLDMRELPDPEPAGPSDVLLRVYEAGVCGTDRDLARFRFGYPPEGRSYLVLGHECLACVAAAGSAVRRVKPGDLVVAKVRRPCVPPCPSCARERADLCLTGRYTEHGIMGADGYFSDYALAGESELLVVPDAMADVAVLAEPLSVVEKAADLAVGLHEPGGRSAAVVGAGTIGLLSALVLQLRGIATTVCSIEPEDSARARLVRAAGLQYTTRPEGQADFVIEAAGSPDAARAALHMLAPLGVCVVLGAPHLPGEFPLMGLIVNNQKVAGSVNAGPAHWEMAVRDLGCFDRRILSRMIERRPFARYAESICGEPGERSKIVHVVAD